MEKAVNAKIEALREDDNVFDVSFEGMGDESATVSATDVKVCVCVCETVCVHVCDCVCPCVYAYACSALCGHGRWESATASGD